MRSYISIIVVAVLASVIANSQPASAEILTVYITGVVNSVYTDNGLTLDGSVNIGSVMTGYCTYDTNTPDEFPANENLGVYPVISLPMTIGNYTFIHDPMGSEAAFFKVTTLHNPHSGASYVGGSRTPRFDGIVYLNGLPKTFDDIPWDRFLLAPIYIKTISKYVTSDALPESFMPLSVYEQASFHIGSSTNHIGPGFKISGEVTSLTVVPGPIEAAVDVDPDTLNLASKGKWLTCYIWLPDDYNVADIEPNSVCLEAEPNDIYADWLWFEEWEDEEYAMAKFRRQELQEILEPGEDVELTITGQLTDGTRFEGTDTIRIISQRPARRGK